jgi:hypothetical protein
MPVHKFITKYRDEVPVHWIPKEVKHPPVRHGQKWEIFAQDSITIQPRGTFTAVLGLGVRMDSGICLISLKQDLKQKRLSLQDGTVSEDVEDIIVNIQNNSDFAVTITEGHSICFANYYYLL